MLTNSRRSFVSSSGTSLKKMAEHENHKDLVQRGYDEIARTYMEWTAKHESPRLEYLGNLLERVPNHSTAAVLELGCGAGTPGTTFLAENFQRVVANDISSAMIALAKDNVQKANVQFNPGDMTKLDFQPSAFDAVVGFYSIIHLPRQEQRDMFKQIWSWLTPGGCLLCNLGTVDNSGKTNKWLDGSEMYWSGFDTDSYLNIFKESGFDSIEAKVLSDNEDGRIVPFLWILARKNS